MGSAAYAKLVTPHQRVHAIAKTALELGAAGDLGAAFAAIEEMNQASAEVVGLLETLAGELNAMEENRLTLAG